MEANFDTGPLRQTGVRLSCAAQASSISCHLRSPQRRAHTSTQLAEFAGPVPSPCGASPEASGGDLLHALLDKRSRGADAGFRDVARAVPCGSSQAPTQKRKASAGRPTFGTHGARRRHTPRHEEKVSCHGMRTCEQRPQGPD